MAVLDWSTVSQSSSEWSVCTRSESRKAERPGVRVESYISRVRHRVTDRVESQQHTHNTK